MQGWFNSRIVWAQSKTMLPYWRYPVRELLMPAHPMWRRANCQKDIFLGSGPRFCCKWQILVPTYRLEWLFSSRIITQNNLKVLRQVRATLRPW